jgi:hypothetical protein
MLQNEKKHGLQECTHMNVESQNWKRTQNCLNKSGKPHCHNAVKINDWHSQETGIEYAWEEKYKRKERWYEKEKYFQIQLEEYTTQSHFIYISSFNPQPFHSFS